VSAPPRPVAPVFALLLALALSGVAAAQTTERVSLDASGAQSQFDNSGQWGVSMSDDARFVAFASFDPALVPGDLNGQIDVFVRNRVLETTTLVSVATDGAQADDLSRWAELSADGRFVVFESKASNLDPADADPTSDVFWHDRDADEDGVLDEPGAIETRLVSVSLGGTGGDGPSAKPAVSADGRFVVFQSAASDLVPGDDNGAEDVFVRDVELATTSLVSVAAGGGPGDQASGGDAASAIDDDGRHVAFSSEATDLVAGDGNGQADVFVRDLLAGLTARVTAAALDGASRRASLSGDGRHVSFTSGASTLVAGDVNGVDDVFVHDRDADGNGVLDEPGGTLTSRASEGAFGPGDGPSGPTGSRLSPDGRHLVFASDASDLLRCDVNGTRDVFLLDRDADEDGILDEPDGRRLERVSLDSTAGQVFGASAPFSRPGVSADGRHVAFESEASGLVPDDTNVQMDVFVRDRATAFSDYGFALAGTHGEPALAGSGALEPGTPVSLRTGCALENAPITIVIGLFALDLPFKGGTYVPSSNLFITGSSGSTPALGGFVLENTWPPGIGSGVETYYQVWVADDAGPFGFASTNAVRGETP